MNKVELIPDPLVPDIVDLRDFPFTPIYRAQLFGSIFHALANDAEWRAGVTLWLKSWDQIPAGTLPQDDFALARLAEFARDMDGWLAVKNRALHGWFLCSDQRLHHPVVARYVLEAWVRKHKISEGARAAANKRWKNKGKSNHAGALPPQYGRNASAMPFDANRQGQGQGQGKEERTPDPTGSAPTGALQKPPSPDDKTWLFNEGLVFLADASGKKPAQLRALVGRWSKLAKDDAQLLRRVFEDAAKAEVADPVPWITKAIEQRLTNSTQLFGGNTDEAWRLMVGGYKKTGVWPFSQGAKPDQRNNRVPPPILEEFGFDPANGS